MPKLIVDIHTVHAAMDSQEAVQDAIQHVAELVAQGLTSGRIRDFNGNHAGDWTLSYEGLTEEKEEENKQEEEEPSSYEYCGLEFCGEKCKVQGSHGDPLPEHLEEGWTVDSDVSDKDRLRKFYVRCPDHPLQPK